MADAWALKILSGPHVGAEITLDPGIWVLGRHEECDLVLTDDTLAERQIELSISPEGVQVSNLAEGQNIYLSGQPQPGSFTLKPYTVVMAGSLYFAVGPSGQPWPELSLSGPPASANPPPASQPSVENFQENGFIETQEVTEPVFSTEAEELDIPTVDDQVDEGDMNEPDEPAPGVLASWLSKASDLFSQNSPKQTITFSAWAKKTPLHSDRNRYRSVPFIDDWQLYLAMDADRSRADSPRQYHSCTADRKNHQHNESTGYSPEETT